MLKEVVSLPNNQNSQISQIPPDTLTYLENLLEDAGMQLTPELKSVMVLDLYGRLEKKLIADAIENMSSENVEEFIKLVQSNPAQEIIQSYIAQHISNAQEVFMQSLIDFRTY